ncbi:MAG: hypothetical protein K2J77_13030 [Oscillospiraceae bacterium]|nr:hypothetical protein [Oscillospiraceae bacterium]
MSSKKPIKIDPGLATIIASVIGAIVSITIAIVNNNKGSSSTPPLPSDSDYSELSDISDGVISTVSSENSEASCIPSELSSSISSTSSPSEYLLDSEPNTSTPRVIMTIMNEDAKVELFGANSGIAYINRGFIEMNYIGTSFGGPTITGWTITLCSYDDSFTFEIVPIQNGTYFDVVFYSSNTPVDTNKIKNLISAELTEKGDLKIEFNFRNNPIDLSSSSKIRLGVLTTNT